MRRMTSLLVLCVVGLGISVSAQGEPFYIIIKEFDKKAALAKDTPAQLHLEFPVKPPYPDNFSLKVDGKSLDIKLTKVMLRNKDVKERIDFLKIHFAVPTTGKQEMVLKYDLGKEAVERKYEIDVGLPVKFNLHGGP